MGYTVVIKISLVIVNSVSSTSSRWDVFSHWFTSLQQQFCRSIGAPLNIVIPLGLSENKIPPNPLVNHNLQYIYIIYIYKHKHNHKWVVYPICRSIPTILLAQIMLIVIYLCHYPRYLTVVSHHITITYGSHEIPSKYHEYPMKFPFKNSFLSINHGPNRGTAHGRPAPSWKRSWLKIHGAYQVF